MTDPIDSASISPNTDKFAEELNVLMGEENDKPLPEIRKPAASLSIEEQVTYEYFGGGPLVDGYTRDEFELLIAWIHLFWLDAGRRPTVDELVTITGWSRTKVSRGCSDHTLYIRLRKRGIDWPKKWSPEASTTADLTPQQLLAIQILTDPTRNEPIKKRLQIIGINYNIYRNWMRNPKFSNAMKTISESMITDNINTVHNALVQKAERGDTNAMKLFYEVSGRHDPMRQQTQDLTSLVKILLEIITRHVTDIGTLTRINNDFTKALSGDTVSPVGELEAHVPDGIVDAEVVEEVPEGFFEL